MTKPKATDEYATFATALKKVLHVSHSELQSALRTEQKRKKKVLAKRSASRALTDHD
jgi:hypothetical protein